MSSIDTHAYPEVSALLWQRDREIDNLRTRGQVDASVEHVAMFWREITQRIDREHELSNLSRMNSEIRSDIGLMRSLQERLQGRREPEARLQLEMVMRILQLLLEALSAIERRLGALRERNYQYYIMYNAAFPKKHEDQIKKDKEKEGDKKEGQKEVKRVLDDMKKPTAAPDKNKQERPPEKKDKQIAP